jgi:hypothetical protein
MFKRFMNVAACRFGTIVLLVLTFFVGTGFELAHAGFGITPPYVRNTSLTRNSVYEQQILLVRGDPGTAQNAEIVIDAPGFDSWFEIVEGMPISLPQGVQKVPMTVRVRVPSDAEFKDYTGSIRIRTMPADGQIQSGAVSISLGALVDVNLTVIDREIKDFRVRKISVSDLNEGVKWGWLFFPGKIRFAMLIENTGNVDIAPSKVEFRIFDRSGSVLLEETRNIGSIDTIAPYGTGEVVAEIPTRLPAGSYVARYRIYNEEEVKQEGDLNISILPAGSVQAAGFGFMGLSLPHKLSVILPLLTVVLTIGYAFVLKRRRNKREQL